jgi:hypothetical protein
MNVSVRQCFPKLIHVSIRDVGVAAALRESVAVAGFVNWGEIKVALRMCAIAAYAMRLIRSAIAASRPTNLE